MKKATSHLSNLLCTIKFLKINSFNLLIQCFCNQTALYIPERKKQETHQFMKLNKTKNVKRKTRKQFIIPVYIVPVINVLLFA